MGDFMQGIARLLLAIVVNTAMGSSSAEAATIITLGSRFNEPQGVAVDGSGNVFAADQQNAVKEIVAAAPAVAAAPLPMLDWRDLRLLIVVLAGSGTHRWRPARS